MFKLCIPTELHPWRVGADLDMMDTSARDTAAAAPATVIVGPVPRRFLRAGSHFARPDEIDWSLLARLAPELILSPLILVRFDVIDLAGRLAALDFRGRYRAVCPLLPRPQVVRDEVRREAPRLDFDLWMFDESGEPAQPGDEDDSGTSPARNRAALAR